MVLEEEAKKVHCGNKEITLQQAVATPGLGRAGRRLGPSEPSTGREVPTAVVPAEAGGTGWAGAGEQKLDIRSSSCCQDEGLLLG